MRPKDKIVSWFIRNIIIPRQEVMDKPGFLITKVTDKSGTIFVRELFISESFIENLEASVVEKFGEKGRDRLYAAGKKFGYIYSSLSHFPTRSKTDKKSFQKNCHLLIQYINCMYAKDIREKISYADKSIEFSMDQFVVYRHNGIGHILTEGGIAGIWAYLNEDPAVEAVQTSCQGRGSKECKVTAAPARLLKSRGIPYRRMGKLGVPKQGDYNRFNSIRPLRFVKNSLQALIDHGFLKYKRGLVTYGGDRYFLAGSSVIFVLEEELKKLDGGGEALFKAAFDLGIQISKDKPSNYSTFITDLFPAFGWGGVSMSEDDTNIKIFIECYPWIGGYEKHDFIIFRGMLSGILSGFLKRKIILGKYNSKIQKDCLNVEISKI